MDPIGLLNSIFTSVQYIDNGRTLLATDGQEHDGRLSFETGISMALTSFKQAQTGADCKILILSEETFLQQELHFCESDDAITLSSLTQAVQSFEDALRSLEVVDDPAVYRQAEKTHPTTRNRTHGCPKDAFHQACDGHRTRLSNSLRTPGIRKIEKEVIKQRIANMKTAVNSYMEKQKTALA